MIYIYGRYVVVQDFSWKTGAVTLYFEVDAADHVVMKSVRSGEVSRDFARPLPLAEIMFAGTGHWIACDRLIHTTVGKELRFVSYEETVVDKLHRLNVNMKDEESCACVQMTYEIVEGTSVIRSYVSITNEGVSPLVLESVTSLVLPMGSVHSNASWTHEWVLTEGHFDWLGEGRWQERKLDDFFPMLQQEMTGHDPRGGHAVVSTGAWSTGSMAPLAFLENKDAGAVWAFQVEHNGAWRWEVGNNTVDGYFAVSGPTNINHAWTKKLDPNECFTTVPASFVLASTQQEAIANLTQYRRACRRVDSTTTQPRIIFNDYMNTINGDPTTEKLLPLISGAAEVGCEIFVVDCGWYDDSGDWWPSVGEWLPSKTRFPGSKGIVEVMDAIKDAGMIPGLWLEPEVIGVKSPVAQKLPDSAFFQRNGHRVVEQERYILDLRDGSARKHLDDVIDRLVNDYGIGYFKMDYNVSPGSGTDYQADSVGDGMLEHNRAYLDWIDGIYRRYPHVILENCSSGGMREDYAQTSRFQVQSTSDQQDYRLYPAIAATAPVMVSPEQAASWAYPQSSMNAEQTAFNINTTLLGRFFLSGYINRMDKSQKAILRHGIQAYRRFVRPVIEQSVPFWPLGIPMWNDSVIALGLRDDSQSLITVWGRNVNEAQSIAKLHVPQYQYQDICVKPIFPVTDEFTPWSTEWNSEQAVLTVRIPPHEYVSRTFQLTGEGGETTYTHC